MANEIIDKEEYKLIDFNGEIPWLRLPNGTYAVDPLYENVFKSTPIK